MSFLTPNAFYWGQPFVAQTAETSAANPQLQYFENFPLHLGSAYIVAASEGTLSIHAVNIPLSLSFNNPVLLFHGNKAATNSGTHSRFWSFGLYSMNNGTLSLANSASVLVTATENMTFTSWYTMATSATQNITPGAWYFALNATSAGQAINSARLWGNSSLGLVNAIPGGFVMGRMTVSTTAMPDAIATSELDITGSDAVRQPYMIITA